LVGRIIFANLLELPLEKYKHFIEKVEKSPLFDKHRLRSLRSLRSLVMTDDTVIARRPEGSMKQSPSAVAKIIMEGRGFAIQYTYEGFNKVYQLDIKNFSNHNSLLSTFFYKLRRISSRNELTHRILKGIIKQQREYLKTGKPADLVPMSQVRLTEWVNKSSSNETQYTSHNKQYDNSWTSRLVNRLSVITPSGEEKPLRCFFQTRQDINKRLIKQLLDRENEDIATAEDAEKSRDRRKKVSAASAVAKKPLTDNQLRAKLEDEYGIRLSRHSVGHCRKDMGIPPASRRLSGYKYPPLSANFSMPFPFVFDSVTKHAPAKSGVYELSSKSNLRTNVFYIGSTKNIRKRLMEHLRKNNKNGLIKNFLKKYNCSFKYIQFLRGWKEEEKRLYKLFAATYGSGPRCNRVQPGGKYI